MHGERMVGALSESIMVVWMDICVQFTCDAANSKDFCTFMKCDAVARSKGLCTFRLAIDFVHGRRMAGAWHKCKRKCKLRCGSEKLIPYEKSIVGNPFPGGRKNQKDRLPW